MLANLTVAETRNLTGGSGRHSSPASIDSEAYGDGPHDCDAGTRQPP